VYTNVTYNDPSWINQLNWGKLINKPTTVAGFGITDMANQSVSSAVNATNATNSTYVSGTQQGNVIYGATLPLAMVQSDTTHLGSFICRSTGTGDSNLAGITYWNDSYAIKMGVRNDGYFGLGGWSSASWRWYVDPSGNMTAAGNVTAYSDPELKENFQPFTNALDLVSKLNGGSFTWKTGYTHTENRAGQKDYGVLADEVEAVFPEMVGQSIEIEGESYKTVAYEKLIPVLIEAIKELKAEVEELKGQIK
jgi:hypothetical protein